MKNLMITFLLFLLGAGTTYAGMWHWAQRAVEVATVRDAAIRDFGEGRICWINTTHPTEVSCVAMSEDVRHILGKWSHGARRDARGNTCRIWLDRSTGAATRIKLNHRGKLNQAQLDLPYSLKPREAAEATRIPGAPLVRQQGAAVERCADVELIPAACTALGIAIEDMDRAHKTPPHPGVHEAFALLCTENP